MTISEKLIEQFLEIAGLLGHDENLLRQGQGQYTYESVVNLEDCRRLLSRAADDEHKVRSKTFFQAIQSRQRLGKGIHDRIQSVAFAGGKFFISEKDQHGLKQHLPIQIKLFSQLEKRLVKNEVWNVTYTEKSEIGDLNNDPAVVINIGHLIMEEGSVIEVDGNVLSLSIQKLTSPDSVDSTLNESDLAKIWIKPRRSSSPTTAKKGANGKDGENSAHGTPLDFVSTILGLQLVDQKLDHHGKDALDGTDGSAGHRGRNGTPCEIAEITIQQLEGNLMITAQAGQGQKGGAGGDGGKGGDGGNGLPGASTIDGVIPHGQGGRGGRGGKAGRGGHGGNGGLSSNIYINVPEDQMSKLILRPMDSKGGKGGQDGRHGRHGKDGLSGKQDEIRIHNDSFQRLSTAQGFGKKGKNRKKPLFFINNRPLLM